MSSRERSCKDVIVPPHPTPPHRIRRRCLVGCGCIFLKEGTQLQGRYCPPHPTPPHPPHLKRCHVECESTYDHVCRAGNAAARTLLSHPTPPHPTPPHPTASEDDALLAVAASVSKEGTQLQGRYSPPHPTPPHPTPPPASETMPC